MAKKDKGDVSQRLTEMLDNEPEQVEQPEQPELGEMDENALIIDYYRVRGREIVDAATIRRLAGKFAAIAADSVAASQWDFDAAHAATQLYTYADTL